MSDIDKRLLRLLSLAKELDIRIHLVSLNIGDNLEPTHIKNKLGIDCITTRTSQDWYFSLVKALKEANL